MYADVNGTELYYERLGDEANPSILTLHGGPGVGDHRKAKEAYEPLTDDYEVVVYDHRGCGLSGEDPPYTNEQFARDANALREHLGLGTVVLIGGSYGGFITQEYLTRFPETVAGSSSGTRRRAASTTSSPARTPAPDSRRFGSEGSTSRRSPSRSSTA